MNISPCDPEQPHPSQNQKTPPPLAAVSAARRESARPVFLVLFHSIVYGGAFGVALLAAFQTTHWFATSVLTALLSLIMTLILWVRIGGTSERPLTLLPVAAFGSLAFYGIAVTLPAVFLSCLFARQLLPKAFHSTDRQFYHGCVLIFALAGANIFLTPFGVIRSADTLISAAFVFLSLYSLLLPLGNLGEWRSWRRDPLRLERLHAATLLFALGLPCVIALSFLPASERNYAALLLIVATILTGQLILQKNRADTLQAQINALHDIGNKSISDEVLIDPSALLKKFLRLAQDLVRADRMLIWTMDQDEHFLMAQIGLPDMGNYLNVQAPFAEGLIGHAAAKLEPRLIPNAARDPHRRLNESAAGAWMLYPIVVNNRLLGLVQCIRSVHRPFIQEELDRLASLVPHVAVALENIRIREEMHLAASTDGLTGLWNHRKMQQILRTELARASRYNRALSVLMMDVDSFKTFNDTYGHPAGDQLLCRVADVLQGSIRNIDYVGRYGGEEFMVVLPETSKDAAYQLAERIRSAVEQQAHVFVKGERVQRTVSVGVASCPEDALAPSELVQRADEALYRAKSNGKNCVIWA